MAWVLLAMLVVSPAWAQQQICAADLDNDGNADQTNEQATCDSFPSGFACPIQRAQCVTPADAPPPVLRASAIGSIVNDDDASGGVLTFSGTTVAEPATGSVAVNITITSPSVALVDRNVQIQSYNLSAQAGSDYQALSTVLVMPANTQTVTAVLTVLGDGAEEGTESMYLMAEDQSDVSTRSWGRVVITDDEPTPSGNGIAVSQGWTLEGTGGNTVRFAVTLSTPVNGTVRMDYATVDGSAVAGTQYTATGGTLTFAPNVVQQFVDVPVMGDALMQPDTRFALTLSNVSATGPLQCPTNPALACLDDGTGTSYCSPNSCVVRSSVVPDIVDPPVVDPPDGPRDANGQCLGELSIFAGVNSRCRRSGVQTAFRNCCRNRGDVIQDSSGSLGAVGAQLKIASTVIRAARAAATGGLAEANQILSAGFDPASLAVMLAMNVLLEMLLESCDEKDMQTALLKDSGYCVSIGTYCAERWPFVGCVQRAEAHCCFNSMLARIVQEQGRPQIPSIGGFGTPREPNCRGFTPEEFQALDFSKIDMTEYFAEIRSKSQNLIEGEVRTRVQAQLGQ